MYTASGIGAFCKPMQFEGGVAKFLLDKKRDKMPHDVLRAAEKIFQVYEQKWGLCTISDVNKMLDFYRKIKND